MKRFDVQAIDLAIPKNRAFDFISDPVQLPNWTNAFASVTAERAVMRTPSGEVTIHLEVQASAEAGTVDWRMTFPDQSVATAFSRLVDVAPDRCVYSFVLTPPPVPLEQLEGALEAQAQTLSHELTRLKEILEQHE
jgi:hypothetical protein